MLCGISFSIIILNTEIFSASSYYHDIFVSECGQIFNHVCISIHLEIVGIDGDGRNDNRNFVFSKSNIAQTNIATSLSGVNPLDVADVFA